MFCVLFVFFSLPAPNFSCPLCRRNVYKFKSRDELMRDELKFIQIQEDDSHLIVFCPCCDSKTGFSSVRDGYNEIVEFMCYNCGIVRCNTECKCGCYKWKRIHDIYETCYYCNVSVKNWTIKRFPKGKGYYFNPPVAGYKGSNDEWCLKNMKKLRTQYFYL